MTDWTVMWVRRLGSLRPTPVDEDGLVDRLRLTAVSLGYALAMAPALALAILSILCIPLGLVTVGFALAFAVVPATAALTAVHRRVSGALLGEELRAAYADTTGTNLFTRPARWVTDRARWRDVGFLWFSATGGFVLSLLPVALLVFPFSSLVQAIVFGGWVQWLLALAGGPVLVGWWCAAPALVRARALAERGILGHRGARTSSSGSRRRVAGRDPRPQRRRGAPDRARPARRRPGPDRGGRHERRPRREADRVRPGRRRGAAPRGPREHHHRARGPALVGRGIHPPALADRGLAGGIEALALPLPLPVTVALDVPSGLPDPVESAAYFAVAECLANTAKHAAATRAWVTGGYADGVLRLVVGDDGRGGADPAGSGLSGVARRLAAFDGRVDVLSPAGGPTVVTMEVPCGR